METIATEPNAFLDWFQTWGQVGYITLQVVYWGVVAWAAVYAARQAKRFVDFQVGRGAAPASRSEVAIEEFVD